MLGLVRFVKVNHFIECECVIAISYLILSFSNAEVLKSLNSYQRLPSAINWFLIYRCRCAAIVFRLPKRCLIFLKSWMYRFCFKCIV